MPVSVRLASAEDAETITAVNVATWSDAYAEIFPADFLARIATPDWQAQRTAGWAELIAENPAFVVFVGPSDGPATGYSGLSLPARDDSGVAELAFIYVLPSEQRSGLGSALIEAVLDHARGAGYTDITLWVFSENAKARAFYAKHGFTPDGTTQAEELSGAEESRLRRAL